MLLRFPGLMFYRFIIRLLSHRGDFLHYIILSIIARVVVAILYALQFLMFGRAIMSWFSPDEDNKIAQFLFMVTEPFVYPIRQLMTKFNLFSNMPIDMSFMVVMIILIVFTTVLNGNLVM